MLVALIMAMFGFATAYAPVAANAGTASSSYGYYTDGGVSYRNQATISTSAGKAVAGTTVWATSGSVPGGWIGLRARLFSGSTLIQEGGTQYNGGSATSIGTGTTRYSSGTWKSYGVTYGWNGSGYNAHYTFQSPNQTS